MEDHAQATDGCRLPPELDDLALIAAIDGEADADVMAHLRACPHCAIRAQQFGDLQRLLRRQLFRMFCPTSETLVAYYQGVLGEGQRESVTAHVTDCPYCSRELRFLKQIAGDPTLSRSPPEPWDLLSASVHRAMVGKLRRVIAEPLPHPAPALVSLYGMLRGSAHTSQYAYQAENLQITIGVRRPAQRADRRIVVGMLAIEDDIPNGLGHATASLLHQETPISTAELDELGNFVLDDLAPGTYRLSLRLPDREVIIEALSL